MVNVNTVLVIAGPTASGKTALAVEAAHAFHGDILSADSMQIYRGMDIGTAKPSVEERRGIPHHLIDVVSPDEPFTVADWQQAAQRSIRSILEKGRLPIVAGGTGLYVNSLVYNLQFNPAGADDGFRERMQALAREKGEKAVHDLLHALDPESAAVIHPNNLVRVIRTLEVVSTTGEPMRQHHIRSRQSPSPWRFVVFGLAPERATLYDRINRRVDRMIANGLAEEVRGLLNAGYARTLQSMRGIGYKELAAWMAGEVAYDVALEQIRQGSRRYAKRQMTWFSRLQGLSWMDPVAMETDMMLRRIRECLEDAGADDFQI